MRGFRGSLALVLGFGLLLSMGCQDKMVRKSDLNALKEHNAKLMKQNEDLRGEVEAMGRQQPQPAPVARTTVATMPPPARAASDIDAIRRQLPPAPAS